MKCSILASTLVLSCAVATLSGCSQVQEPASICNMSAIAAQRQLAAAPSRVQGGESPVIEMPLNSVNITDYAIINKIYVRTVNARRTPTGTVEVYAQVINCTDFPLNAEARTQFYDAGQAPSEPSICRHAPPILTRRNPLARKAPRSTWLN